MLGSESRGAGAPIDDLAEARPRLKHTEVRQTEGRSRRVRVIALVIGLLLCSGAVAGLNLLPSPLPPEGSYQALFQLFVFVAVVSALAVLVVIVQAWTAWGADLGTAEASRSRPPTVERRRQEVERSNVQQSKRFILTVLIVIAGIAVIAFLLPMILYGLAVD